MSQTTTARARDAFDAAIVAYGSLEGLGLLMRDNPGVVPGAWTGGGFERRTSYELPKPVRVAAPPVRVRRPRAYRSGPLQDGLRCRVAVRWRPR